MDKDSHGQIARIFAIANRFDIGIDFHLDFGPIRAISARLARNRVNRTCVTALQYEALRQFEILHRVRAIRSPSLVLAGLED